MKADTLEQVLDFIDRLYEEHTHFTLSAPTTRALMVTVRLPGSRWEIEFLEGGDIRIEVFESTGVTVGPERLKEFFELCRD